jgi:hypothetical protein
MSITVTITGDTPAEIMTALKGLSNSQVTSNGEIVIYPEKPSLNGAKKVEKPAEKEQIPAAVQTEVTSPSITLESVRSKVQAKSKVGKRESIKDLLTEFGVERVTSLEKTQYADFISKLEAL